MTLKLGFPFPLVEITLMRDTFWFANLLPPFHLVAKEDKHVIKADSVEHFVGGAALLKKLQ